MMLEESLKQQLKTYLEMLENDVEFVLSIDASDASKRVQGFVEEVVAMSDTLSIVTESLAYTPSFALRQKGSDARIEFAAVPLGHEFASFVLALLQVSGRAPKVDDAVVKRIQSINTPLHFETYISLTCHICPDVVQALNIMSVLNPKISHTMIDGALFKETVDALNILAVPTVYLNGEEFGGGRMSIDMILDQVIGKASLDIDTSITYDVMVVGGGPAGVSSAIYAARKGLKVGIISDRMGGQVLETMAIENLIGTPYTEGPKLSIALEEHLKEYPIDIIKPFKVESLRKEDKLVTLELDSGDTLTSKTVIIATGARWRNVNVPGEQEFKNKGVAYCPHCDGPMFKDKRVAVIGGGNSGIEAAIDLAGITRHVTVVEFMPELKADEVLQKRLHSLKNVDVITNAQTTEIHGDASVNALSYKDRDTESVHTLDLDGVFVQIGLVPNTEWTQDLLEKTRMGEIVVTPKGETNIPGIFAAGDCSNSAYKQIIISMGSGATAALSAFDYLIRDL